MKKSLSWGQVRLAEQENDYLALEVEPPYAPTTFPTVRPMNYSLLVDAQHSVDVGCELIGFTSCIVKVL